MTATTLRASVPAADPLPVTRFFRFLRSTEMALVTMGALALVVGLGTIVPQRLKTDPSDYAIWKAHLPWLVGPAEALGLTDLYRSPVFLGFAALFTVNLAACTWSQAGRALRRLRPRTGASRSPGRSAAGGEGRERLFLVSGAGDRLHTGGQVVRFFEGSGYSMRSLGPGRWEGRRRWWGHAALPAFHVALLLVVFGALMVSAFSFRGILELAEGQGFVAGTDVFLRSSRGILGRTPPDGFAVRLDSFRSAYHPNGQIRVRESDVSVRSGGREGRHLLSSSHPATAGGFRLYQSTRFGWAPLLRLSLPDGREQDGFVNLAEFGEGEQESDTRRYRQQATPPGTSLSILLEYEAPLNTQVGTGATSEKLAVQVTQGDEPVYRGDLSLGQTVGLPDGSKLTYLEMRRWSGLVVVGTPGLWLVYLGGALSILTLLVHFTVVPERIRVSAARQPDGAAVYRLTGWRRRYGSAYSERLQALAARLEAQLQGAPESRQDRQS